MLIMIFQAAFSTHMTYLRRYESMNLRQSLTARCNDTTCFGHLKPQIRQALKKMLYSVLQGFMDMHTLHRFAVTTMGAVINPRHIRD